MGANETGSKAVQHLSLSVQWLDTDQAQGPRWWKAESKRRQSQSSIDRGSGDKTLSYCKQARAIRGGHVWEVGIRQSPNLKALWTSPPADKRWALTKTSFRFGEGRAPHLASYVNCNRSPVCLCNIPVWDRKARLTGWRPNSDLVFLWTRKLPSLGFRFLSTKDRHWCISLLFRSLVLERKQIQTWMAILLARNTSWLVESPIHLWRLLGPQGNHWTRRLLSSLPAHWPSAFSGCGYSFLSPSRFLSTAVWPQVLASFKREHWVKKVSSWCDFKLACFTSVHCFFLIIPHSFYWNFICPSPPQ